MAFEDILAPVHLRVLLLHPRETETTSVKLNVEFWLAHCLSLAICKEVKACEVILGEEGLPRVDAVQPKARHYMSDWLNHSLWSWDKLCPIPTYLQLCCWTMTIIMLENHLINTLDLHILAVLGLRLWDKAIETSTRQQNSGCCRPYLLWLFTVFLADGSVENHDFYVFWLLFPLSSI